MNLFLKIAIDVLLFGLLSLFILIGAIAVLIKQEPLDLWLDSIDFIPFLVLLTLFWSIRRHTGVINQSDNQRLKNNGA